jgi:hypothetical protein
VLSNPSHPDLPAKLRLAAAAITASNHNTLRVWLQGGLFTHLLHILGSLPALKLSPADATDVCAATTAVLVNIIFVARDHVSCLPGSATLEQVTNAIGSLDVLAAVVKYGMMGPAAVERLQPGREIHVEHIKQWRTRGTPSNGSWPQGPTQFWTPLRICGHLLLAVSMQHMVDSWGMSNFYERISKTVLPAVNTDVFRHLLETVLEDPTGSEYLATVATRALIHDFCVLPCWSFWTALEAGVWKACCSPCRALCSKQCPLAGMRARLEHYCVCYFGPRHRWCS